ncbi:MAG: CPBP family intramembrane metalloprotease [Myxococcales bacterium]|nr:CPBP family intramembrane metalloprotease [Myxococcales bacterium]
MQQRRDERLSVAVIARALIVCALGFSYIAAFWFYPAQRWPLYRSIYAATRWLLDRLPLRRPLRWVLQSWSFVGAAVLVLAAAGRSPRSLGLARATRQGWRLVGVAFVAALPVMIVVGMQQAVQRYYAAIFRADGVMALVANALVLLSEHVILQGVILALALPSGTLQREEEPLRRGRLAALGLGLPDGERGVLAWLGVPAGVWPALVFSAVLFGLVHAGKASAEIAAAFPGGLGLALLTYRVRAVWPAVLLHASSGVVIFAVAWFGRSG